MPFVIYMLGVTIFSLVTSEFMVAGMMQPLTAAFNVSVAEVGYLISLYAAGMVIGGPILTTVLLKLRVPNKRALLWLLFLYALAQAIAAMATSYGILAVARVITGVVGSACFGVSLAICAEVVAVHLRARAVSIVISGLMLSTVLGLPLATLVEQQAGWRASFWLVVVLALVCAVVIGFLVPVARQTEAASLQRELASFKNPHLWAAYVTSALIIGATLAAFSYFAPILTEISGFAPTAIPWLLALYGVTNVVGNMVVGRYADKYTIGIMVAGLIALAVALIVFAGFAHYKVISLAMVIVIGLVGIPMNPAMVARIMKTAHPGPLVNTVHTSVINIGLACGAWLGGLGIHAGYGLRSPLWVGVLLAGLGLASLLPYLGKKQAI
jgi:predicted MFS family arabinose efflux permease